MIRLTRALVRQPGLSERAVGAKHDEFVRGFAANAAVKRYVRGFVAANALLTILPGQPPRIYDGLMDVWFDDAAALRRFLRDDDYLAIETNAPAVFDVSKCTYVVTGDYPPVIAGGLARPGFYDAEKIRFSTLLVRNAAFSFEAFVEHHRTKHAPLFASVRAVTKNISRYVIAHRIDVAGIGPSPKLYDGIVEFYFDDVVAMTEVFVDRNYLMRVKPDELRFLELSECDIVLCKEIAPPASYANGMR